MPLVATGSTRLALHRVGDGVLVENERVRPTSRRHGSRALGPGGGDAADCRDVLILFETDDFETSGGASPSGLLGATAIQWLADHKRAPATLPDAVTQG